jgi:hypothetical protein
MLEEFCENVVSPNRWLKAGKTWIEADPLADCWSKRQIWTLNKEVSSHPRVKHLARVLQASF